eukprot:CAMPEP_0185274146 /NCGR_PEP_ID=MMETSP1359-20130426/51167_1 /TAXON_ID=552665 /ORGANISM="Bigelowiella longifila, Strain CCMP242" /LENGTH=329 /DNA_ID=CAMNT_0027867015 /DNA_START=86 /DNA_END=1078 /DNA_ORIENTATION=-
MSSKGGIVNAEPFTYGKDQKAVRLMVMDGKGKQSVAEIAYYGAHIMTFKDIDSSGKETPLMWMSSKAVLDGTKAIRGGVPVIFPQFNAFGPMKSHGFARISVWSLVGITSDVPGLSITATFRLTPNELSKAMWGADKDFVYDYKVTLKANAVTSAGAPANSVLEIESTITNTGKVDFGFTCALHTYFPVSDIGQATVSAVEPYTVKGLKYIDQLAEGKDRADKVVSQESPEITFDREVDRIYLNIPKLLQVTDKKTGLRIIQETNFSDAIVWNPWIDKAKRMSQKDYGEMEYKEMVCVEVAEVGTKGNKVELKPTEVCKRTVSITSASS